MLINYCYLSFNQKFDDLALERVLSAPKKGIGNSTINQIYDFSNKYKIAY